VLHAASSALGVRRSISDANVRETAAVESDAQPRTVSRRVGVLRVLGLDIIGPLVAYRACRAAGLDEVWSLVIAGSLPGLGVLVDYLRWRTVDVVGVVVLSGIGISIVLAIVTDDPKVVLLESAAITAAFGIACLLSLSARRPLIFYFGQAFYGGRHSSDGAELDADYDTYEEARYFWRIVTAVWGLTHIALGAALAAIVQTSSTSTALTFNRTVPWILNGGLIAWSVRWGERLRAEKPSEDEPATE
jgi:hypothetical protein